MKTGFHVDYQEMRPYYLDVTAWLGAVTEVLDSLDIHFQEVADEEGLQGEAAEAIKAYITEFHQPLIAGIKLLLEQFHDKLLLYIDDYYTQVDDATDTYLDEEILKSHLEMIENRRSMLDTCQEEIMAAMEGSGISAPQRNLMEDAEGELAAKIKQTMENVWLVEESHTDTLEETETLLSSLNSLMQSFVWQVDKRGSGYRVGSLSENGAYREFARACELAGMEQGRMAEVLEEVQEREYARRAVELRIDESNEKIMMGVTAVGIGLETIFLAPRAPLRVLGYFMRASGSISTGYGLSEGAEGWQGLSFGVAGDYLTDTDNFVCDVFFGGDEEAYHAVGKGSMYVSGILSLGTEGYHIGRAVMQKSGSFKNWLTNWLRAGDDVHEGGSGGRLISRTEGVVTGGDSTKLGKNMMESMGLPRGTNWTGHQAQHIIPAEMANHPVLQRIGMDLDDASNGLFLRTPADDISAMSRHRGYHSTYNEFVRTQLDGIDINQSVDVLQKQVYDLQQNLKYLQQSGLPLYPSQGATVDLWQRSLERIQ